MKTIHDYLDIMCGYKSPLYNKITNSHCSVCMTVCGRMLYISIEMILGGKY